MGNQPLNSLALLSARYTHEAINCFSQLVAINLMASCQALDLRAMHMIFLENFSPTFDELIFGVLSAASEPQHEIHSIKRECWKLFSAGVGINSSLDTEERFEATMHGLYAVLIPVLATSDIAIKKLQIWESEAVTAASKCWRTTLEAYAVHGDATEMLGIGAKGMYNFVRKELGIRFIRESTFTTPATDLNAVHEDGSLHCQAIPTIGDLVTRIYRSIRNGQCYARAMDCLAQV